MHHQNIHINYARLRRHYELNLKSFDEVSLLDLSHALRMWMDMKISVEEYISDNSSNIRFKSYIVPKQLTRLIAHKEYILAGLPGSVSTWAGNNEVVSSTLYDDTVRPFYVGLGYRHDGSIFHIHQILTINNINVTQENIKILQDRLPVKSYTFTQWLSSEIVRVCYLTNDKKLERKIIPREIFVNRVANILGGSHPIGIHDTDNQFNDAVRYLMNIRFGGLPTPYFLILKVAKDILDNVIVKPTP